ncbi:site-specific DNA-methyltransferase [Rhodococcus qingshengii]|uniref:site-specific DNA-methyltransferase n=1 Tax=Rhodococcus qingshengii TaxID=334542 RepID=UPI0018DA52D4|nr:site-specific DNA-methyltransferase [Rhodococcus qingshengii]QPG89677.1 site-specific DNA-methyltransferase [Rhodococcus qingshengii]
MVDAVELVWPNKDLPLLASGLTSYEWVQPTDRRLSKPLKSAAIYPGNFGPTSNVLAIGDGLDALESLQQTHVFDGGKVRLVYIDPPFNTGKSFNQYGDNLARPMWLSMLRDRLAALKPVLHDDASIWVHLDDSEVHRARAVMDEVFGERAFVASVVWQKRTTRDSRAAFSSNHDTILVYAPSGPRAWKASRNLLNKDEALMQNRDDDPRGPWSDAPFTAPGFRKAQQYDIVTPTGVILRPPRSRSWYATEKTFQDLLTDDRIWFPKGGNGSPRIKLFANQLRGLVPFTVWGSSDVGTNDDAKRHLQELFPDISVFDTPKPEELLERIIHIATKPGELVLDLFAGSGTTAAVAHKMGRRWITVERNTQTVLDFTFPRLQRVVQGSDPGGITKQIQWNGGGEFDLMHVSPRIGTLSVSHRAPTITREIANKRTVRPTTKRKAG